MSNQPQPSSTRWHVVRSQSPVVYWGGGYTLEHSNSRFESNRFDSLCESIRIDSFCKKNRLFDSLEHAVFLAYLLYSLSQRISWRYRLRRLILQNVDKNSYAMHTLKITPNSLFDYRCTSGKFIRLPNRIESNRNFFCPNWNALYTQVYGVYQPPGFFWQRILASVIINKQGTFSPLATPLCVYPPPFLAIHHCQSPIQTCDKYQCSFYPFAEI